LLFSGVIQQPLSTAWRL